MKYFWKFSLISIPRKLIREIFILIFLSVIGNTSATATSNRNQSTIYESIGIPLDSENHIIGGSEVTIEEYPYQVAIHMFGSHHCGGSIISENRILTAAHCVSAYHESILSVRVGSAKTYEGGKIIEIEKRHFHPDFNKSPADYDVAVLILKENLTFSEKIQKINLEQLPLIIGENAVVSGWGKNDNGTITKNLNAVEVKIVNQLKCVRAYEQAGYVITERMLCAGSHQGGKDACQGDSGGPLVCQSTGKVCGIVSWGHGCALTGYPGIYTKVSSVYQWIVQFL